MDDESEDQIPDEDPEYVNPHPELVAVPDVPQSDTPGPKNDPVPEE